MGGSSSRGTSRQEAPTTTQTTPQLSPEQRALMQQELGVRTAFLDRLQGPVLDLLGGITGGLGAGNFGTDIGPVTQSAIGGQFGANPQLANLLAQRRQAEIGAAQFAAAPAIGETVRGVEQAVSSRGFGPGSTIFGQEIATALGPHVQQLASIGQQAAARETEGLINQPRQDIFNRAGLEQGARGGAFAQNLQLLGLPLNLVGGGPGTLGQTAPFTATTGTTGGSMTSTSGRQPGQGLFK